MGEVDGSRGRGLASRNAVPVMPASPWHLLLLTLPAADPRLLVPRPCASHRNTESAHAMGGAVLQCFLNSKSGGQQTLIPVPIISVRTCTS
jgi:hypothetical protein